MQGARPEPSLGSCPQCHADKCWGHETMWKFDRFFDVLWMFANTLWHWRKLVYPTRSPSTQWWVVKRGKRRGIPDSQAWLYHGKSLTPLRSYLHLIELLPHWVIQRLPASKISNQSTLKCDSFTILYYPIPSYTTCFGSVTVVAWKWQASELLSALRRLRLPHSLSVAKV